MNSLYEVIAGNVGTVYAGADVKLARTVFDAYIRASKANTGRVSGEPVTLFYAGEIDDEYLPPEVAAQEQ